ncbi:hypothetical protein Hanom_Chr03g00208711 [Helianthus anomalus]
MKNIKMGSFKLKVNIARFALENEAFGELGRKGLATEEEFQHPASENNEPKVAAFRFRNPNISFRDMAAPKGVTDDVGARGVLRVVFLGLGFFGSGCSRFQN